MHRRQQQARDGIGPDVGRRGRGRRRAGGGRRGFRRRVPSPPAALALGGRDALAAALVFARHGLPVGLVCSPSGGSGAPATASASPGAAAAPDLADALIRHHAGVLAGCAAIQADRPRRAVLLRRRPRGRRSAGGRPVGGALPARRRAARGPGGPAARRRRPPHHQPRARLAGLHAGRLRFARARPLRAPT